MSAWIEEGRDASKAVIKARALLAPNERCPRESSQLCFAKDAKRGSPLFAERDAKRGPPANAGLEIKVSHPK
jgi:hypothetical protein